MPFQKGHTYKHTEESKKKMSLSKKGKLPWITGRKHTEEAKTKMRSHKGKNTGNSNGFKKGIVPWNKGLHYENPKISAVLKGKTRELSRNWRGGISFDPVHIRRRYTYSSIIRRARLAKSKGKYTLKQWLLLKAFYQYMCLCCKKQEPEIKLTVDHITPLSKGGDNGIENIQPLCSSCNNRKFLKIIDYRSQTTNLKI